jgi:hypothetical protein
MPHMTEVARAAHSLVLRFRLERATAYFGGTEICPVQIPFFGPSHLGFGAMR